MMIGSVAAKRSILVLLGIAVAGLSLSAQTVRQAWMPYADQTAGAGPRVIALGEDALERSAVRELERDLPGLQVRRGALLPAEVCLGTLDELRAKQRVVGLPDHLKAEGYWIGRAQGAGNGRVVIAGADPRGVLYGAFALLRATAAGRAIDEGSSEPAMTIRWMDDWDNPDGSIERGYAGRSLFFEAGHVRGDLSAVREYARLLASVGVNGVNVNNVNNATLFLTPGMMGELARAAAAMRPYGVRMAISVDIASPQRIGGLATFDPLDKNVQAWWAARVDELYRAIPDLAGFTVKADSEGQAGPSSYGRTPADAANVLADALRPHGGVVLYRAFVYNHHLDWRDAHADRARAAYDIFHPLDGAFRNNVIVQVKEGPIDFQAREPVSPLFAGMDRTAMAMELQVTQEYTGQQRHLVYLAPMWKWVLETDLHARAAESTPVKRMIAGNVYAHALGGVVGVSGVGQQRWLASPLALANLYAFGRLAWNPDLEPRAIAGEWAAQSFGASAGSRFEKAEEKTVVDMLMRSWPAYENYTGPLGLQTLTDITGSHYGPNIESSERNGWGQWHDADARGVGKDRSVATGSGYAGQYPAELARQYESTATTPDDLMLFFHHLPYTTRLHSGKTVIQEIYDRHYDGAATAARFGDEWETRSGRIDAASYDDVLERLRYQAAHAVVWRDAVTQYFLRLSGIADEKGRAGNYPGRMEAEDAQLTGYRVVDVQPWEDASHGRAVACDGAVACGAAWRYAGADGRFNLAVQYFDLAGGVAEFELWVNDARVATWKANAQLPSDHPHGDNSTRFTAPAVELHPGDRIRVEGHADQQDKAVLDYVEVDAAADAR